MNIRYRVELSEVERTELTALLSGGKHAARKIKRAQILLAADAGTSDDVIASTLSVGGSTVYRTKETALLIATACSNPPEGRKRWTLDLLADAMVRLTAHEDLSRETVRRRLAEDALKPWRRDMWCIPQIDGTYVARMEDVLYLYYYDDNDEPQLHGSSGITRKFIPKPAYYAMAHLYAEEADPKHPVVCFDESPTQLIGEVRKLIPPEPGQPERCILPSWHGQLVRVSRCAQALAACEGDGSANGAGFCCLHARSVRYPLSGCRPGPRRDGQSFNPHCRGSV